jgi:hypothetical protein
MSKANAKDVKPLQEAKNHNNLPYKNEMKIGKSVFKPSFTPSLAE